MKRGRDDFIFAGIVAAGTLLQVTGLFAIFGVKPNIAFVLLAALSSFVVSFSSFALLTGVAAALLSGAGAGTRAVVVFALLSVAVFLIGSRLPGKAFVNTAALAVLGTFLFYLVLDPVFFGRAAGTVALEAAANGALGAALVAAFRKLFPHAYAAKARTAV